MSNTKFDANCRNLTGVQRQILDLFLQNRTDEEIAELRGNAFVRGVPRLIKEIAKKFDIEIKPDEGRQAYYRKLLNLCRLHVPDRVSSPHYCDESSFDCRRSTSVKSSQASTNYIDTSLPVKTNDLQASPGSLATSKNNALQNINLVQTVKESIKGLVERDCKCIRYVDGRPREVENIHVDISCLKDRQRLPLIEFVVGHFEQNELKPIALLGKAGSGKTNSLKFLAMQCIEDRLFPDLVPFYIKLRNEDWESPEKLKLRDLIQRKWQKCCEISETVTEEILKSGSLLLLLDGLDEVPTQDRRKVEEHIDWFALREYPRNKVIVTYRTASADYYTSQYEYIEIADLSDAGIASFIEQYHQDFVKQGFIKDRFTNRTCEDLIAQLNDHRRTQIKQLARTPIYLTLICKVFFKDGQLPNKRHELYESAFNILVREWNWKKRILCWAGETFTNFMFFLSRETFQDNKDFSEQALKNYLDQYLKRSDCQEWSHKATYTPEELLDQIKCRSGLLTVQQEDYSFSHLTWHEYFVARHVANQVENETGDLKALFRHLPNPQWREIFLFVERYYRDPRDFYSKCKMKLMRFLITHIYKKY